MKKILLGSATLLFLGVGCFAFDSELNDRYVNLLVDTRAQAERVLNHAARMQREVIALEADRLTRMYKNSRTKRLALRHRARNYVRQKVALLERQKRKIEREVARLRRMVTNSITLNKAQRALRVVQNFKRKIADETNYTLRMRQRQLRGW